MSVDKKPITAEKAVEIEKELEAAEGSKEEIAPVADEVKEEE